MKKQSNDLLKGLLFISPWLIGFLWLTIIPMAMSFYYAFTDFNLIERAHWVGLDNFKALFSDRLVGITLYNTFWFTVIGLPLSLIIALGLAVLLNQKIRGLSILPDNLLYAFGGSGSRGFSLLDVVFKSSFRAF